MAEQNTQEPIIFLDNISVTFKTRTGSILHPNLVHAVNGLTLKLMPGETIGLVGESGCGKSTTANVMCGLQSPTSGHVYFKGEDVTKRTAELRKKIGRVVSVVFQNPATALNPRMAVHDQLLDPLVVHNVGTEDEREDRICELFGLVGLPTSAMYALPGQLSGGQRQRIAIARALAPEPELLLLDEPLGALDLQLRRQMQLELKRLQKKLGITFVYITHDQEEAINMSDRIAVMRGGRFEQLGTPEEIYDEPKTHYVAQFIGRSTILSGKVESVGKDTAVIRGACGSFTADASRARLSAGEDCEICVRTERMRVSPVPVEGFQLPVTVREARYAGGSVLTYAILPDGEEAVATSEGRLSDALTPGSTAYLYWNPAQAAVIGGTSHGA